MFKFAIRDFKIDYIMILIMFFASFRSAPPGVFSYSVPNVIRLLQVGALPITIVLICISIFRFFNGFFLTNRLIFYNSIFLYAVYVSEIFNNGLAVDPIAKILIIYLVSLFFSNTLTVRLKSEMAESLLYNFYLGIMAFVLINTIIYVLGIGSLMWKGRFFGLTSHPNFIGLISSIGASLSTFYLYNSKGKLLSLFFLIAALYITILSGSRNAVLSYILFSSSMFFFFTKNYFLKCLIIFGGLSLVCVFFLNFSINDLDFEGRGNTREGTWAKMWDDVSNLSLLGRGKGGSTSNGFLFVLTSSGIIGGLFFYLAFISFVSSSFTKQNMSPSLTILVKSSIIWITVSSLFEGYFLDTVSVQLFFCLFLYSIYQVKRNDSNHPAPYSVLQK